ncbi:PadR family transcriptional regulator [Agrococcus sp. SCSIO52902]|uniref:PadR family transcriptional regulator n=1 Tax=Agrococcus sp. SCSIO52902 TaxID=2933290 RepID=UPI001FF46080|nr:PadR family transcriptional regulator [Agrococcus sp. SCSIO52902]UOW01026.1 PadR family transcriptional regulator [Agrococcus sp. SCSIO52902]
MILSRIILGLLDLAPMTGADLKRHFDTTVNHFWSADKAQIYRTLGTIVDDGHATVTVVPGTNTPDRLEHHLTPAGREALHDWLRSDLDRQPEREAFLARVFLADALDDDELSALIEQRRALALARRGEFEAIRDAMPEPATRAEHLRFATLDHGLRHVQVELDWLDALEEQLP